VEAKAKKEAKRQRVVEEEERKKRTREYLQRLWDEVLEEEATLLEGTEGRLEESNWGSTAGMPQSKWGVLTPARGVCVPGRTAWCTPQGEYFVIILIFYFLIIFFFIAVPLPVPDALHSSSGVYPTPPLSPQP